MKGSFGASWTVLLFQIIKAPRSSSPLSPSGPDQDSTVLCARRHCLDVLLEPSLLKSSHPFQRILGEREKFTVVLSSLKQILAYSPFPFNTVGTVNAKLQGKGSIFSRMYLQTYRIWVHIRRVPCAKILGQALHGTFKVPFVGAALTPWDRLPQCLLLCRFTWLPGRLFSFTQFDLRGTAFAQRQMFSSPLTFRDWISKFW